MFNSGTYLIFWTMKSTFSSMAAYNSSDSMFWETFKLINFLDLGPFFFGDSLTSSKNTIIWETILTFLQFFCGFLTDFI
jgi:hypothetical protein